MNIPFEQLIYDETAAITEVARKKKDAANYNHKAAIHNRILIFVSAICILAIAAAIFAHLQGKAHPMGQWMSTIFISLAGGALCTGPFIFFWKSKTDEYELCSANALYYLYTSGYTPIKVELEETLLGGYEISITMEDEKHIVCTAEITECRIYEHSKTDIQKPVLNLKEGAYYVPYVDTNENETSF